MHLILTGATGLIGTSVLQNMLAQESITRVSILSRGAVKIAEGHDKARVIIHKDFENYYKELLDQLNDAQGCVEYVKITPDYPFAAAKAFSTLHPESPFTFVYVSGEGVTYTPGRFSSLSAHVKGQTEMALVEMAKHNAMFSVINVRPSAVDWKDHTEIHPFMPRQPMWKSAIIVPLNAVYTSTMTPTRSMARIMTELVMSKGAPPHGSGAEMHGMLVTNAAIRRMAGT